MATNPWDKIVPPSKDLSARRIDHEHPLNLFWARDYIGKYLFIYEFTERAGTDFGKLPNLVGISSDFISPKDPDEKQKLILSLNEQSNWELFYAVCSDLVQATKEIKTDSLAVHTIIRRLVRWQDFLKKNRNPYLTEEQIKGLLGELLLITDHLIPVFGETDAIHFWQGPEGLPQDFNVNNSAIEVKSQSGITTPKVKISSLDQLCTQLNTMYLFVVTLGKATSDASNAINLPSLVAEIRDLVSVNAPDQLERFEDLLFLAGYVNSDYYKDFNYILANSLFFEVTGDFPRICPDDVKAGIDNVSYNIRLGDCKQFARNPEWVIMG